VTQSIDLLRRARELVGEGTPSAVVTIVKGGPVGARVLVTSETTEGQIDDAALHSAAVDAGRAALSDGASGIVTLPGDVDAFVDLFALPPLLVLIGAVHVAQAIVPFAQALGFRIAVADARATLATEERFPDVDDLLVAWPDEAYTQLPIDGNSAIVILTHDPKFDEPAILGALKTNAGYIGAVGSRKTNADRRVRLLDGGATEADLERVHGPIGLNIGGSTPQEMAISILAEVIAVRNGRDGGFLRESRGSIRGNG
jgi:xanthine dehydrogenase accessory factor